MNLSCLLGTSPEETDFTWPWLSSGKCSSFAVFIFGFPSVLLGLQLILSFWVASWAAGTKSSSKQFAWSFPEDLEVTRSLGELDLGPPGACAHAAFDGEEVSVAAACTGKGVEKPLGNLPSDGQGICSPLGEVVAGMLLLGAGTSGRDQLCVAVCTNWWQVSMVHVAWVLELGLPLTQVHLTCSYCHEDPPEQTLPAPALPPV